MTARLGALDPVARHPARGGMYLGFRTVLRKELTDWIRSRGALVTVLVSTAIAAFTTLIPFVVRASGGEATTVPPLSMDPTVNVLLGWNGGQTTALTAILATMSLLTQERDRGTLAWNLTNPVAPASIVAAKFVAAVLVLGTAAVAVPLAASAVVATIAYGTAPNLGTVALFGALFLTVPALYAGLTVTLGTFVKSTAGVAGIAILLLFVPGVLGALIPVVTELSPTSVAGWAYRVASGVPTSSLTVISWLITVVALFIAAKVVFDRQEL